MPGQHSFAKLLGHDDFENASLCCLNGECGRMVCYHACMADSRRAVVTESLNQK